MSAINILNAVKHRLKAQEATAAATLEMFINKTAGVPDHSNIVGEAEKQIKLLTEAKECLAMLDTIAKHMASTQESTEN